jgi:hypothetical protein
LALTGKSSHEGLWIWAAPNKRCSKFCALLHKQIKPILRTFKRAIGLMHDVIDALAIGLVEHLGDRLLDIQPIPVGASRPNRAIKKLINAASCVF